MDSKNIKQVGSYGGHAMTAKYIVLDYSAMHGETLFIFPETVKHSDFAHDMGRMRTIVSAGFVRQVGFNFACFGRSDSLGIDSRPDADTALANIMFGRM